MTDQDHATQVLRTFPLFVSKLFTQDERQDAISAIAAYGQERFRAGVEASIAVVQECREEGETDHRSIKARIGELLVEQEEKT